MVKVNYKDIITTPMVSFCVFVANFEHIHTFLVLLLLNLNI